MKKDQFLKSFNNKEITSGINKAFNNACELIDEAMILENNEKVTRAFTLYQLGLEEFGKSIGLFFLLLDRFYDREINYLTYYNDFFRNHIAKTSEVLKSTEDYLKLIEIMSGYNMNEFINTFKENSISPKKVNTLKNNSLYVDFDSNGFFSPSIKITKGMVTNINSQCIIIKRTFTFLGNLSENKIKIIEDYLRIKHSSNNNTIIN